MSYRFVRVFVCIILTFIELNLSAQNISWQRTIGGDLLEIASCIKPTSDGGFIIGGISRSNASGEKSEHNWDTTLTTSDFWVIKLDAFGNIVWENTIGGRNNDGVGDIIETFDGGFFIGGSSSSDISGDKTMNGCNTYINYGDFWVVKLNSSGNIEWQKNIGGLASERLISMAQTSSGGFVLGGISDSNISCDKTEINNAGSNGGGYPGAGGGTFDYWIVKIDSVGNLLCQKTLGRGAWASDFLRSVSSTFDGGFIVGGESYGPWASPAYGGYDNWIVKLNSNCITEWQKVIGGDDNERFGEIKQLADGGYICGSTSRSGVSGLKSEPSFGGDDFWIFKLDLNGNIVWQKTIGGSGQDMLSSISTTQDGGYICGGYSNSPISGLKTGSNLGSDDYWILKLDSIGNIEWQRTIGGTASDQLRSVYELVNGNFIIGGSSSSNISGDKTENSRGSYDYWILELEVNTDHNLITGKTFFDLNGNNIKDSSDIYLPYKIIRENNSNRFAFSQPDGSYFLSFPDTGNYSVSQVQNAYYLNSFPSVHSVTFNGMNQIDSLNDFAIQQTIFVNDLQVSITPVGAFRPGFNASYNIKYKNIGTTTLSGIVTFFPDPSLSFISSNPTPSAIYSDSVVWQTLSLNPLDERSILVSVNVNAATPNGQWINSSVRIHSLVLDQDTSNNFDSWEHLVTGSYDPNDILVDKDTITTWELAGSTFLDYVIRFQNTGSDTAFTVKISNPIDATRLDLMTFEIESSSHPFNLNYIPWDRTLEFKFENILLPDSNINEAASHGFVRYRIKPKASIAVHDSIVNYAAIYFDYNLPVLTNKAVTHIIYPSNHVEIFAAFCRSFTSPSGNFIWTNSGIYFDTLYGGLSGVDSIYVLHLTEKSTYRNLNVTSCESYVSPSGNFIWTSSGIYSDTLVNAAGCDSVIYVNLNINFPVTSQVLVHQCSSYQSPSGNYTWTVSGTYYDTLSTVQGCDSILMIDLTINQTAVSSITSSVCDSYISPSGNYTWTVSGTYYDTLSTVQGCDSILMIDLTIYQTAVSSIISSVCDSYISPSGNHTWTVSGTYYDTLSTVHGCDSILMIDLTISNSSASFIQIYKCQSYISPSGNQFWNSSGIYSDTIPNTFGCDSIIIIDLTIFNHSSSHSNISACNSFVSPSGNFTWTSSGTYLDVISNAQGCDSLMTIDLLINSVDTVVILNAPLMYANVAGAAYQWMYCDSSLIQGQINQTFIASSNGSYAVIITQLGCTDTSACFSVMNVGIGHDIPSDELSIFPNPAQNILTVRFSNRIDNDADITIIDILGNVVFRSQEKFQENAFLKTIDTSQFSDGMYFLFLGINGQTFSKKFIKQ